MTKIYFSSVEVCDADKTALPKQNNGYPVIFSPKPLGATDQLYLKITCTVIPNLNVQATFILTMGFPDDYRFLIGTGIDVKYIRQVVSDTPIYLPFQVKNLKPLEDCVPCDLTLQVRETASTIQTPSLIIRLYGK